MRLCSESDCEEKHYGLGLCKPHYRKAYRNPKPCKVENCPEPHAARGYCDAHRALVSRGGTPSKLTVKRNDLARFDAKHTKYENGCWLWTGGIQPKGYGTFRFRGKHYLAHRAAYEMFVGPIPDGLEIDHTCCVRHCVNPDHLEPVTPSENVLRSYRRRKEYV